MKKYFCENIRFLFPSEKVRNVLVGPELSALVQVDLVVVEVGGVPEEQPHAALEAGQAVLGRVVGVAVAQRVHEAVEVGHPELQRGLDNRDTTYSPVYIKITKHLCGEVCQILRFQILSIAIKTTSPPADLTPENGLVGASRAPGLLP